MVSTVSITKNTALGKDLSKMDSHAIKYFVASYGFLVTNGDLSKKVLALLPISYSAIVPRQSECEKSSRSSVPFCLACVGYAPLSMEPVFKVLGQSAATAACIAIQHGESVQDIPYSLLYKNLLEDGQILEWAIKDQHSSYRKVKKN